MRWCFGSCGISSYRQLNCNDNFIASLSACQRQLNRESLRSIRERAGGCAACASDGLEVIMFGNTVLPYFPPAKPQARPEPSRASEHLASREAEVHLRQLRC